MAYRKFLIQGIHILLGLAVIPTVTAHTQGQWQMPSIPKNQSANVTRTPTPLATATLSPSPEPTDTPTNTVTPKQTLTPTHIPTFTATTTSSPTSPLPPSPCPCQVYLPLTFAIPLTAIQEIEPNNTFAQAQTLSTLLANLNGTHDGLTNTGDVFQTGLTAGQIVHVTLTTENLTGVQLLAYHGEPPTEIVRDFAPPFELTFLAIATGTYYLYIFTPGEVNNGEAYTLSATLTEANP